MSFWVTRFALAARPQILAAVIHNLRMRTAQNGPKNTGFTLLEILLAVGITATILLAASGLLSAALEAQVKTRAMQEVETQSLQALHQVLQAVRNAETVIAPLPGTSANALSLDVADASLDPTSFSVSSDALRVTEGITATQPLTNTRIRIFGLTIENLSRTGTPGTVRIQFTAENINPSGRSEYTFQETFIGSATLRHP